MYKDLTVPVTSHPGDDDAVAVALELATHFNAHVSILEILDLPMPDSGPWGWTSGVAVNDVCSRLRAQGEVNVARRRASLEHVDASVEVRMVESRYVEPGRMAAQCARYADLAIASVGSDGADEHRVAHAHLAALLLEAGRPVLAVPPGARLSLPLQHVLLAWHPTAEATRALHDALPLLTGAERVDVVAVDPPGGECGDGEQPGAAIATHLARHGVRANVVVRASHSRPVASILLEHARQMPAQLIVAGGYGHSRLREWVMGGVTRDLLASSPVPLLFSH